MAEKLEGENIFETSEQKDVSPETGESISPEQRRGVASFFDADTFLSEDARKQIEQTIGEIKNRETSKQLWHIYSKILGVEAEIRAAKHGAVLDLAEATNIPPHLLETSLPALAAGAKAVSENELVTRHREGNSRLEKFVAEARRPYNLFYIDKNLTTDQLTERLALLDSLRRSFQELPFSDRDKVEQVLNQMFAVPKMPDHVQSFLDEIEITSRKSAGGYRFSEGKENKNLIYQGTEFQSQVIKITMERHDTDFTSVLKLMRNMHALALHYNQHNPPESNVQTEAVFDDMTIYRDPQGNYKRLVRQEFAAGIPIKSLPKEIKENDPDFRAAWQAFLRYAESMKKEYGVVLDMTDSVVAGYKKARGNVANTENVFVTLPSAEDGKYKFAIIDPDVFDTSSVHDEYKFDPTDIIRKKGLRGLPNFAKMLGTNAAREWVVGWQNQFVNRELKRT